MALSDVFRKTVNVVYGTVETATGSALVVTGAFFGAVPLFDGARRLYRETPQSVKNFVSRFATGKDAASKVSKPKGVLSYLADIALSGGVLATGMGLFFLGGIAAVYVAAVSGAAGGFALLPLAGAVLMVGAVGSTAKRVFSFFKDCVKIGAKGNDGASAPAGAAPSVTPVAALSGKEAASAFKAAVSEKAVSASPSAPGIKPTLV